MNTTGVYKQNVCGKTCTVSYPTQLVLTRDQDQYFSSSHTFSPTATAKSWASLFVSPCPPECYLKRETKIEPDLRLNWSWLWRPLFSPKVLLNTYFSDFWCKKLFFWVWLEWRHEHHWSREYFVTCTLHYNNALSLLKPTFVRNKLPIALFPAVLSLWIGNRNMCRIFKRKLKRTAFVIQIPLQHFLRVKWTDGKTWK